LHEPLPLPSVVLQPAPTNAATTPTITSTAMLLTVSLLSFRSVPHLQPRQARRWHGPNICMVHAAGEPRNRFRRSALRETAPCPMLAAFDGPGVLFGAKAVFA
jgi:hypothetical protein